MVVRPGLNTVALRNRQEAELGVTEEKKKKKRQRGQMVWICPKEGFGMYG